MEHLKGLGWLSQWSDRDKMPRKLGEKGQTVPYKAMSKFQWNIYFLPACIKRLGNIKRGYHAGCYRPVTSLSEVSTWTDP